MAFNLGDEEPQQLSDINLIPLIDIMLVLMIIFLITATVLNPTVPLNLPQTVAQINEQPKTIMQISIQADGKIFLDHQTISIAQLEQQFSQQQTATETPNIHLRADKDATYDTIAKVLALASKYQLTHIAFVTEAE